MKSIFELNDFEVKSSKDFYTFSCSHCGRDYSIQYEIIEKKEE